ncbi:MAG: OmpA family protein [Chitinophagaceae bacterium]
MKTRIYLSALLFLLINNITFSQDAEGCKEHPMFPTRMSNYLISDCKHNYDAVNFNLAVEESKMLTKEGTNTQIQYNFNFESGQQKPSVLQILRNYENAAKKFGATTVFLNVNEGIGVFKLMKNGKETAWIKVQTGGSDGTDFYVLNILELEEMKQEISSADILNALNTDGHISLYINFETGKSAIKPESQIIIDQVTEMLKTNSSLKISIEGHTDNVGTPAANKLLSENRARAVMDALVAKGIDKSRLLAKGWGQDKPVQDNNTDEGKAKNRRVEIVKL